jgi:hypothetical protein
MYEKAQWHAAGLRWLASLLEAVADRLEAPRIQTYDTTDGVFDSDCYLADLRNRVFTRYY